MKKMIVVLMALLVMGCADKLNSYLDDPGTIIQDPHYAEYQAQLDALEHRYLQKEISYAEYLDKKSQLEDTYTKEVNERTEVIYGNDKP